MKIISKKCSDSKIITDLETGEKIDISHMSVKEMEEMQYALKLSDNDFDILQMAITMAKVEAAEAAYDMRREDRMMAKNNKKIKTAQEFEMPHHQLNPDFDIKKTVRNDDEAAAFITDVIMLMPEALPNFIGMTREELAIRIKKNLDALMSQKNLDPKVLDKLRKQKPDFDNAIRSIQSMLALLSPPNHILKDIIYPIMGFRVGQKDFIQRLYDYVPIAVKGSGDIEKEITEDNKGSGKQAVDSILDQYNAGKIDKQRMEQMMKEFSGYIPFLVKTADGIKIQWKKDSIKVRKVADGKYRLSKESWEKIGKQNGWMEIN